MRQFIWIDGFSALVAGIVLFVGRHFWSELFALPTGLLAVQSAVNFCYAAYSLSLARREHQPEWMIRLLIAGNLVYPLCVVGLLWWYGRTCTALGVVYFLLEIAFIAGLGLVEWWTLRQTKHRSSNSGYE